MGKASLYARYLLATNKLVGLVTVILSSIVFNFLLFHITLDPAGLPPAIVVAVLLVLVIIGNKGQVPSAFEIDRFSDQIDSRANRLLPYRRSLFYLSLEFVSTKAF